MYFNDLLDVVGRSEDQPQRPRPLYNSLPYEYDRISLPWLCYMAKGILQVLFNWLWVNQKRFRWAWVNYTGSLTLDLEVRDGESQRPERFTTWERVSLSLLALKMEGTLWQEPKHIFKLRVTAGQQWERKWGPQSYNCKELNCSNNLTELGRDSSPVQPPDENTAWLTSQLQNPEQGILLNLVWTPDLWTPRDNKWVLF